MAVEFNPFSPEFRANPYPYYEQLRVAEPIFPVPGMNVWVLTRYNDIVWVLRDQRFSADRIRPEMFGCEPGIAFDHTALMRTVSRMMLVLDSPDHTRIRGLVSKAFTPRVVENLRPRIQAIVDEIIDRLEKQGRMELIADLAYPVPVIVIAELLGVPVNDFDQLRRWSDRLAVIVDGTIIMKGITEAEQAAGEMSEYFQRIFVDRRATPRADLISALVAAQDQNGVLSDHELLATCMLLLIAGHETTTNLIGNGMLALLRHPAQLKLLREQPPLIAYAIEELLRYDSPVQVTSRIPKEDVEIDGHRIPAGHEVDLILGAANYDPTQFKDPYRLDIARTDNRHLSFGHGSHFCLGAALARIEGQIAIETLVRRLPSLRLATDTIEWREGLVLRGVKSLPLEW